MTTADETKAPEGIELFNFASSVFIQGQFFKTRFSGTRPKNKTGRTNRPGKTTFNMNNCSLGPSYHCSILSMPG